MSQLICKGNQLTAFYMIATLAFNELSGLNNNKIRINKLNVLKPKKTPGQH